MELGGWPQPFLCRHPRGILAAVLQVAEAACGQGRGARAGGKPGAGGARGLWLTKGYSSGSCSDVIASPLERGNAGGTKQWDRRDNQHQLTGLGATIFHDFSLKGDARHGLLGELHSLFGM